MKRILLFGLLIFSGISFCWSQDYYPKLTEICTDNAGIMTSDELQSMRQKLKNFETETTHQIVVLTINSLGNESIESFALNVFNDNQLGQGDKDNGILILFAKDDRKVRIEVGYGLEPIMTDAISSRIIRNVMIPKFKNEDYFEGLDEGTDEIIKIISDPKYADEFAQETESSETMPFWGKILVFLLFFGFLGIFVAVGTALFWSAYKDLINAYRGLFSGRISVLSFPFMLLGTLFALVFGLVFMLGPLIGLFFIFSQLILDGSLNSIFYGFNAPQETIIWALMTIVAILFVILPIILGILKVTNLDKKALAFSLLKSDKKFIKKHISFSSSGGSSSRTYSSSGSSSSFSGGGGSSGGGGASGSW